MAGADYYELLGVPNAATQEEIRKAYRKQALRWHPDRNSGTALATQHFSQIAEAYEALSDPAKRRIYDLFGERGLKEDVTEDISVSSHGQRSKRSGAGSHRDRSRPTPPPPQNSSRSSNVNESPRYNYRTQTAYTDDSSKASQAEVPPAFRRTSTRRDRRRDSTGPYGEISPHIYLWALYTSSVEGQHAPRRPFTTPQRSDSDFMPLPGVMDLFPSPPRSRLRDYMSKLRIKGNTPQTIDARNNASAEKDPSRMPHFLRKLRAESNATRAPSERSPLGRMFDKLKFTFK